MMSIGVKIKEYIQRVEESKLSFGGGVFLLYGIMFIRTFLENYANSGNFYHMSGIIDTFFHYPFFFSMVILTSIVIARIITKEEIIKVAKFIALCSFGLIAPPIIDLILHTGGQIPYIFISGSYHELGRSFITYFGGGAIGIGIKIETALALLSFGVYIWSKTKQIKKSIIGILVLYSAVFIFLASPTLIFGLQNALSRQYPSVGTNNIVDFYYHREPKNAITSNRTFILEKNNFLSESVQKVENQTSMTLSIVFLTVHAILFFWCLFLYSSKKFFAVIKNFRYMRIVHNLILICLGIFLGIGVLGKIPVGSLFDFLSFVSLFSAFFFAWLFVVWENDETDIEIDKITNQDRPLSRGVITLSEWQTLKYIFLAYALCFAFLCGLYVFIFILLFIFIYHIYQVYSLAPTRLKRFPIISSLLIAINALCMVWMGFFIGAGTENLSMFPARFVFGILAIFILVENAKNIKDIAGDKKEGIKTLPVIFGEKWGRLIAGFCLFLGALLVPIVFYLNFYTFVVSVIFGLVLFFLANKKNFQEKYLFFSYFAYCAIVILLLILS